MFRNWLWAVITRWMIPFETGKPTEEGKPQGILEADVGSWNDHGGGRNKCVYTGQEKFPLKKQLPNHTRAWAEHHPEVRDERWWLKRGCGRSKITSARYLHNNEDFVWWDSIVLGNFFDDLQKNIHCQTPKRAIKLISRNLNPCVLIPPAYVNARRHVPAK